MTNSFEDVFQVIYEAGKPDPVDMRHYRETIEYKSFWDRVKGKKKMVVKVPGIPSANGRAELTKYMLETQYRPRTQLGDRVLYRRCSAVLEYKNFWGRVKGKKTWVVKEEIRLTVSDFVGPDAARARYEPRHEGMGNSGSGPRDNRYDRCLPAILLYLIN